MFALRHQAFYPRLSGLRPLELVRLPEQELRRHLPRQSEAQQDPHDGSAQPRCSQHEEERDTEATEGLWKGTRLPNGTIDMDIL